MHLDAQTVLEPPLYGKPAFIPLPPVSDWYVGDFVTPISNTTDPVSIVSAGGSNQLQAAAFRAAATTTNILKVPFQLPPNYKRHENRDGREQVLKLVLAARVVDLTGSATANTNLAITATATFTSPVINPDTGVMSAGSAFVSSDAATAYKLGALTDTTAVTGAADAADNAPENIRLYVADLYTGVTDAEKKAITPFTLGSLAISVNETVGTNLRLEIFGGWLVFDDHNSVEKYLKTLTGH